MNNHFLSQVRLSCDDKFTPNRANSNFHLQSAIVILAPICRIWHSDSLDTLLYVRFAIQNFAFYEWKQGDRGWALSWHCTHTLLALWPDVTSCFTYEKRERKEVFSFVSNSRFKNLQLHWEICNSIVCILMRGVQWALWFVTSSWSECLSDQRFAAKLSAWWAAKRRPISNDRHGVISLLILANNSFSFG